MNFKASKSLIAISFLSLSLTGLRLSGSDDAGKDLFIDWAGLKNPVLAEPDRMLKDQAVVYNDGWFYIFCSSRFESDDPDQDKKTHWIYKTRDFRTYERFYDDDLDVRKDSGLERGMGSPDVTRWDGTWYMVWQSGPDGTRRRNLFYSTSLDLEDWTPSIQLNPALKLNARRIDGALAYESGFYYIGYKSRQRFRVARSEGPELDGNWLPSKSASAGGGWAENYQFIKIDGQWFMIATARDPEKPIDTGYTASHESFIYMMDGDGSVYRHWTRWVDKRQLKVPCEDWNRAMHANSAYLCDWRNHDGYFYLFYAGSNDHTSFDRRGHGKIGVIRSRDLENWNVPGDMRE